MRNFFHADTTVFPRRLKAVLIAVLVPLGAVCIFCAAVILFNMRSDGDKSFAMFMVYVICGCVALGMVVCFLGAYITDKMIRRHARYTYLDILPRGVVYSRYSGEHYLYGERTIYRRLFYIPFKSIEDMTRDPKLTPMSLTIKGEVREYLLASHQLGYHIDGDGELVFDRPELNERHFEQRTALVINGDFGSTKQLLRSLEHYLDVFRNTPEKKPFNIADYVVGRPKKPLRTSNPLLDAPSFERKW